MKRGKLLALCAAAGSWIALAGPAAAVPPPIKPAHAQRICEIVHHEAQARGLPAAYFTRLIWKESRFNPKAVSPKGAQGIAQFMPDTAKLRGLVDPFRPGEALTASAQLLADLARALGNLGLAAAAYNAGLARVRDWLDGRRRLPSETLDYVESITGRPASDWSRSDARHPIPEIGRGKVADCVKFASRGGYRLAVAAKAGKSGADKAADSGWKPWGAQIAGARSEKAALAMFEQIRARHSDILGGLKPLVVRKRNLGMGLKPVANVRIGAASRAEAEQFCAKLMKKNVACVALRN